MKILDFFYFVGFLPSWIRLRIHNLNADPDPATQINANPCGSGSGSETLSYCLSVVDPDPYWTRIQSDHWIRIWIRNLNTDPDPDPGGQK
jgi:hypothetical protein